jgi:hypothetical protein
LLAPIYIPLAFGLIWPVFIASHALFTKSLHRIRVSRNWIAILLFPVSLCCSLPFMIGEYQSFVRERERARANQLWQVQWRAQQAEERQQADQAIRAGGITAFTAPLTAPQLDALKGYLENNSVATPDLLRASEHYRTSIPLMRYFADKYSCPPGVLESVFNNALSLQSHPPSSDTGEVWHILHSLAFNPNTPVPVLIKLLQNDSSGVRMAAAVSPRLPKPDKIAYLRRACASRDFGERKEAAGNPDTPPELLEQLAVDPITAGDVASNPSAPIDILETLANSKTEWLKIRARDSLAKRRATK